MMKRAWNHYSLQCEISVGLLIVGALLTAPGVFMVSRGGNGGILYLAGGIVLLAAGVLGLLAALVMNRQREARCMAGKTVPVRFVRTVWDLKSRSSGIRNPDLVNGKASAGNARVIVDASMSQDGMAGRILRRRKRCAHLLLYGTTGQKCAPARKGGGPCKCEQSGRIYGDLVKDHHIRG